MHVRTPLDLGLVIRERRRQLGLSQSQLAEQAGVGRQWLVAVERGKSRAEIGLVLQTLYALGLALSVVPQPNPSPADDIDAIVSSLKEDDQ